MRRWRRLVNRIRFAIKFVKITQGDVKLTISRDNLKEKFFRYAEIRLAKVEKNILEDDKIEIYNNLHDLISLALKVPDIFIIK